MEKRILYMLHFLNELEELDELILRDSTIESMEVIALSETEVDDLKDLMKQSNVEIIVRDGEPVIRDEGLID